MGTVFGLKTDKHKVMIAVNILSLITLGLVIQIGGAYLVNAAVYLLGEGSLQGSAAASAAAQYGEYMERIRSIEPRQYANVLFVAPLVEEIVFRLLFLRAGKMVMPFWAANILQAALFGIYHSVTIQKVYGFLMGLIIGCVCHYCPIIYRNFIKKMNETSENVPERGLADVPDSLLGVAITFVLHAVINAGGLFIAPLMPADIAVSLQLVIGFLLMALAVAACLLLMRRAKEVRR